MPAYKTTRRVNEHRLGWTTEVVIMADSYAALSDPDAAIEVGVFAWTSVKDDLDISSGQRPPSEMSFTITPRLVMSDAEHDAVSFALESIETYRYIGLLRNPHAEVIDSDFRFRGVVRASLSAESKKWFGAEYSGDVNALREWDATAVTVDLAAVLDASLEELVKLIEPEWIAENVRDQLGCFKEGERELRFAELVGFETLMTKLLELASPPGVTLLFESTFTDLRPWRVVWKYDTWRGRNLRYSNKNALGVDPVTGKEGINPWGEVNVPLRLGFDNFMEVSWRLLAPTQDEVPFSWLRYGTLGELIFQLAIEFDCFPRFTYAGTTITVSLGARSIVSTDEIYIRDAIKDSLDIHAIDDDAEESKAYTGAATTLVKEGIREYMYDGAFTVPLPGDRVEPDAVRLPLTLSPTFCYLQHMGYDLDTNLDGGCLPHNAVMYDGGVQRAKNVESDLRGLHSAIYIRTAGTMSDGSELDVEFISMPAVGVRTKIDGVNREFRSMAELVNFRRARDGKFFEGERNVTVPFYSGFRSTPDGPDDWRVLGIGKTITLEGQLWTIVGIEDKADPISIDLRLHLPERFNIEEPAETLEGTEPPMAALPPSAGMVEPRAVPSYLAGEGLERGVVGVVLADGLVYRAHAHHEHYGLVMGLVVADVLEGGRISLQRMGPYELPEEITFDVGAKVYLRTAATGTNLSTTFLAGTTATEDMVVRIGQVTDEGSIYIDIQPCEVYYPPLEDDV